MIRQPSRSWATRGFEASDSVGTAVLGAGPAGLTAAYVLALGGHQGVVYEADSAVGGIARTMQRGGYLFDLGGQAFSTNLEPVQRLWETLLGDELICRPRLARIHSGGKLSRRNGRGTTLIENCHYPRLGPGQMWDALHDVLVGSGIAVRLDHRCTSIRHDEGRVSSVVLRSNGNHLESRVEGVLSSIPLGQLVGCLQPRPPADVLEAAKRLRYQSLCAVVLMTSEQEPFPENWIYLHDANIRAARVQNFGAWSQDMVEPGTACLGVEYSCAYGDEIWRMNEVEAVELAKQELARIGLIDPSRVFDGARIRLVDAYPSCDGDSRDSVEVIREYLAQFENLETFGRNGLHCANTQDHSVWTAMLAASNLLDGASHDVWEVDSSPEVFEPSTVNDSLPDGGSLVPEPAVQWAG